MMTRFQVPAEKVPMLGQRAFLQVEHRFIALFNVNDTLYAITAAHIKVLHSLVESWKGKSSNVVPMVYVLIWKAVICSIQPI